MNNLKTKKNLKARVLSTAAAAALGICLSSGAHADALATSVLILQDFQLTDGTNILDAGAGGNIVINSFTTTANSDSDLNGGSPVASDSQNSNDDPLPLDTYACVGDCSAYTENTFTMLSSATGAPDTTYALGDTAESGSPVANFGGLTSPADVAEASYVSLVGDVSGSSSTNQTLTAEWEITAVDDIDLTIDFTAISYLEAFVTDGVNEQANASMSITFTVTNVDTDTVILEWAPGASIEGGVASDGLANLNTGVGTSASNLEAHCGTGCDFGVEGTLGGFASDAYSADMTQLLVAGGTYSIFATFTTVTDATSVPAPASLALFGLGLIVLGGVARRRTPKRLLAA